MTNQFLEFTVYGLFLGIGATAIMDVYAWFIKVVFNVSSLNLSMLGRWLGHCFKGSIMHNGIENSETIKGEVIIGQVAHYGIGITLAFFLLMIWNTQWVENPSLVPALKIGVGTVVLPLFILQPCFGMGIAATKMPKPYVVQLKSLSAHFVFGVGLYLSGLMTAIISK